MSDIFFYFWTNFENLDNNQKIKISKIQKDIFVLTICFGQKTKKTRDIFN